jgi:sec-independent protein translocase protein TatA
MPDIGPTELLVIAVIALLVLGPKRLPEAGRGLGRGIREFRQAITPHADRSSGVDTTSTLAAAASESAAPNPSQEIAR